MKTIAISPDKIAISLSILCAIHCLVLPFIILLLPSIAAISLEGEAFHFWMLVAVVPISIFALRSGYIQHKRISITITGMAGVFLLISAVIIGETYLGEFGEKFLTLAGATLIALSHYKNLSLCKMPKST